MPLGNGHNLPMVIAMPTLVQDEAGQLFIDTGGGVYHPVNEDQARAFQENPNMLENMGASAGQGLENLITGAGSLLSDDPYWQQANQAGRARSEALNLAQPVAGPLAQFAPQAAAGIATAAATGGASIPAQIGASMGVEGLLGAAATPETPLQGAALGALGGAVGAALPPLVTATGRAAGRAARNIELPAWMRRGDAMDIPTGNAGGMRPGERQPLDTLAPDGAANLADDMSAAPSQVRPGSAGSGDAVGDLPLSPSANPPSIQQAVDDATARAQQAYQAGDAQALRDALVQQQQAQQRNAAAQATPRMADRVSARLEEPAPQLRTLEGTLTPEELYDLGVPTSDAQRQMLRARAGTNEFLLGKEARGREEALMSSDMLGGNLRAIRDEQKAAATNFIARELGVERGVSLTDPVLGDVMQNVGRRMDDIAAEMGNVPFDAEMRRGIAEIHENVTGPHGAQLRRITDEIEAKAKNNGGMVSGDDWLKMRTRLNEMAKVGTGQTSFDKVADARAVLELMEQHMEAKLPAALQLEMRSLRKKYAIAQTAIKGRATDPQGQINATSFYNNWKRPQSKKRWGRDDVGSFMNTMSTLSHQFTPDSGTARRLDVMRGAARAGAQVGAAALGMGAAGSILGGLL